jgi:alpha-mannosidase
LQHGLLICEKAFAKAFFTLTHGEEAAKEGEYPIFVFNPHPYPIKQVIDCEFTLADQNFEEATSLITVYDGDKALPTQMIREHSMLNCDWRKRVLFEAELPPMAMKRFSAFAEFVRQPARQAKDGGITVTEGDNSVTISEDGFLTSFKVNGKEYIDGKAFAPFVYDDNVDAWAMDDSQILGVGKNPKAILPTKEKIGVFKNSTGVKVIEDGSVCTSVQACFATNNITLRTVYTIYKKDFYIDVKVMAVFNEADKFLKLHIPTTLKNADFQGQTVFGAETLDTDGREVVAQRFVSLTEQGEKEGLAILNNCLYGHSYKDGEVRLSLVRGAGYCVHPVDNQPFISETEYVDRLDQGETEFNFRIMVAKQDALEREAAIFNQKPFALNLFPTKNGEVKAAEKVIVSNDEIVMSAFKKKDKEDRFVIRLFNNSNKEKNSRIKVLSVEKELRFTKYEVKTLIYDNSNLLEIDEMVI